MSLEFDQAVREWQAEVDEEAIRLIKLGVPPTDATIQARQRIQRRRREQGAQRSIDRMVQHGYRAVND